MFKYSRIMSSPALTGDSTVRLEPGRTKISQTQYMQSSSSLDPRIADYLTKTSHTFDDDKFTYALVVPLGADESWEETANGDAFLREDLRPERDDWGHKTFEALSNAFMHHRNKDPNLGFGKMLYTCFNDSMDRVEGIWRLDNEKAKQVGAWDFVNAVRENRPTNISMGTHVPFDVCMVCGNCAKNTMEYCAHTKYPGFGSITPEGVKVRVANPKPRFFDLSGVTVNAAHEAAVLALLGREFLAAANLVKTSSFNQAIPYIPSAILGEVMYGGGLGKFSASKIEVLKVSDLVKEVPALMSEVIEPLQDQEADLPLEELVEESGGNLPQLLSTLASLGIVLHPEEFTKASSLCGLSTHSGPIPTQEIARAFAAALPTTLLDARAYSPSLAKSVAPYVPKRTILLPMFGDRLKGVRKRAIRTKKPELSISITIDGHPAAAVYAGYIRSLCDEFAELLKKVLLSYPKHTTDCLGADTVKISSDPRAAVFPFAYLSNLAGVRDPVKISQMIQRNSGIHTAHLLGGAV